MASRSTTTYLSDELDSKQPSKAQNCGESGSGEENVVEEFMGTGESTETEADGTSEELTEAVEAAKHKSMSSPSVSRAPAADAEDGDGESGEADEADEATEFVFETVPGWEESTPTETGSTETGGEALTEAYYSDKETSGQEFFGLIAAAFVPLVKAVLPSLAGAAFNQGVKSLRLRKLLARLSKLGINPQKRRETDEESDEATEVDEATLSMLELQLQVLEAKEVIIGNVDSRARVTNTKDNPWKRICHLRIETVTGLVFQGTGFFIGPRTIVTAGHCVYMHDHEGWAKKITVTPGRNGEETPFKSYTATSLRSVQGWVNNKLRDYDYGAIILPESAAIPSEIGAFGFGYYSDKSLKKMKRLDTAGYPGDQPGPQKQPPQPIQPRQTLWFDGRKAKDVTPRTIIYNFDTAGGQSGSPVWFKAIKIINGKKTIETKVVGIHTNGDQSGNSATRITRPVFENLKKWRVEGGLPSSKG